MIKPVYLTLAAMLVLLFFGAKVSKKGQWNEEALAIGPMKCWQGFAAVCIMLHHIGQKTSADWLPEYVNRLPGLEFFVEIGYIFVSLFLFCSGYGLMKSRMTKKDYLDGFAKKRIVPVLFSSYVVILAYFIVRYILGERVGVTGILCFITQIQLCNVNGWYVVAQPLFYLAFFLSFRFIKKDWLAMLTTTLFVLAYVLVGTTQDHHAGWILNGEWWYNCVLVFPVGILFARYEKKVLAHLKKYFWFYLIASLLLINPAYQHSYHIREKISYYGELFDPAHRISRRWVCLLSETLACLVPLLFVTVLSLKVKIGNRVLRLMGSITLEFYLVHGLFVELFSYNFIGAFGPILPIQNLALYILAVLVPSLPLAILLRNARVALTKRLCRPKASVAEVERLS